MQVKLTAKGSLNGKLNNPTIREYPELEDITITPTTEEQHLKSEKYGYGNITVEAGLDIYDYFEKEIPKGTNVYMQNSGFIKIFKKIPKLKISENATYAFAEYEFPIKLNFEEIDTSETTNMNYMFYEYKNTELDVSNLITDNVTTMMRMFGYLRNVTEIDISNSNISKVTDIHQMFQQAQKLITLKFSKHSADSVNKAYDFFDGAKCVENFSGIVNLGKGYTDKRNNYSSYKFDVSPCTNLTHESLMNVINNLYDLNLTYDVANGGTLYTQALSLGTDNKAKLTDEEIAIANVKGWTVS